ncbi:MAG: helix-turn-helix domain-containing protein [Bacteroidaceae bacterium]|nr:helix-turn-helix domain-containing protein [Bacteroidaceae bacterium]
MCQEQPNISLTARLKVKDCAQILQMSKRSVQRYITAGKLKAHLVGNSYRVFGRDLIIFWRAN